MPLSRPGASEPSSIASFDEDVSSRCAVHPTSKRASKRVRMLRVGAPHVPAIAPRTPAIFGESRAREFRHADQSSILPVRRFTMIAPVTQRLLAVLLFDDL